MNETPTESIASEEEILKAKDTVIREQAKRIEYLENEVEKVRKERDRLSTKVALLSHKLHLNKASKPTRICR